MVEIEKPRITCFDDLEDPSYGKYVVEPLERGYGMTLGNSLRRIMLSSLPGYAATSVKIAGVQHEFSTIPGVTEDVTEIVLNVKRMILKLHSQGVKTVYIDAVGPYEVTAGDIKADGEVEILNPELHICTLGEGATFNMEITLSQGRGYVPADRNKTAQTVIGVIPIDSIYSPVNKVNYSVEPTRVGDKTDFDKLTLEVWTNSTICAKDAVCLGAKILSDHLTVFTNLSDSVSAGSTVVEKSSDRPDTKLSMTIDELDLSVRSFNCLKRANINTVADLISKTDEDMMNTVKDVAKLHPDQVKIHLLHVIKGTVMAQMYENGEYEPLTKERYVGLVADAIELLPEDIVIARLTGDGMAEDLLVPEWSKKKVSVINDIDKLLYDRNSWQGKRID